MTKKNIEMKLIESREQLLENVATLKKYLTDNEQSNRAFAVEIIQNGMTFYVVQEDNCFSFFPSRFIGYKKNSKTKHEQANAKKLLDGKETNPRISKILAKKNINSEEAEKEYKKFCQHIGITKITNKKRTYWILNEIEFLLKDMSDGTKKVIQSLENNKSFHITTAEKEQIVKARFGQSKIREKLLEIRKHCELCKIKQEELLVASHIKPWSESDEYEKGDLNNLLLLCAMHDALFDKGFISFDEKGKIIISKELNEKELKKYLLDKEMQIAVDKTKSKYLEYHMSKIFKK